MIHEWIHDIIVKSLTNLLFSYVLNHTINECICQCYILSGRGGRRHFYDTLIKIYRRKGRADGVYSCEAYARLN